MSYAQGIEVWKAEYVERNAKRQPNQHLFTPFRNNSRKQAASSYVKRNPDSFVRTMQRYNEGIAGLPKGVRGWAKIAKGTVEMSNLPAAKEWKRKATGLERVTHNPKGKHVLRRRTSGGGMGRLIQS